MTVTQHYLWAGGHCLLLLTSLRYLYTYVTFQSAHYAWWYRTSFLGALVSYAIVCNKALGPISFELPFLYRALADENVQYFLLALFWWYSKPIPIALFPYIVFSLFHALTFVRTTILPKVTTSATPAGASPGGSPPSSSIGRAIQSWVKANYDHAMRITAYAELLILARVVLGVLTLQNSILVPIVYAQFMKTRYYHSAFTREALGKVGKGIDDFVAGSMIPPSVKPSVARGWVLFKNALRSWGGNVITEAGAGPRRSGTTRG